MKRRPLSITIISWIFIVFGSIALLSGVLPLADITFAQLIPDLKKHWMVHLSRVLAVVAGVAMLYGRNWARWLLVIWIVFHLVISALPSVIQLALHAAIFTVILYFLFRRESSSYFLPGSTRY